MYREGPKGFNVPYGHYKSITNIINKEELDTISHLIKDVEFIHSNFCDSIKNINEGDFVYMDPPYAPENETSFVGYNLDGFDLETHELLFNEIKNLENIKFIMSNSNVPLVIEHFENYEKVLLVVRLMLKIQLLLQKKLLFIIDHKIYYVILNVSLLPQK